MLFYIILESGGSNNRMSDDFWEQFVVLNTRNGSNILVLVSRQ